MFDPPRVGRRLALTLSALAISLVVLFAVAPQHAWAAEDDIASGDCGTCVWSIDADGKLTIAPEDGKSGQLPQIYGADGVPWYSHRNDIKTVIVSLGVRANMQCGSLFQGCSKLASIDVSGFDLSCANDIHDMFRDCFRLRTADLSPLSLSKVENASGLFRDCVSLSSVDLEGVDFSSLSEAQEMFSGCQSLGDIDLSSLSLSEVENASGLFRDCASLSGVNLEGVGFSSLSAASEMFRGCRSLEDIDLSFVLKTRLSDMRDMFEGCTKLSSVDFSGYSFDQAIDVSRMFYGCSGLESVNLSGAKFPRLDSMIGMFGACSSLTRVDLSNLDIHSVSNADVMFEIDSALKSISLGGLDCDAASSVSGMFYGCSTLSEVDFSQVKANGIKDASSMFSGCSDLVSVDLSGIDSLISSSDSMFYGCYKLRTIYDDGGLLFSWGDGYSDSRAFYSCLKLSGGNGTVYDSSEVGARYARIDKPGQAGYFTCKHLDVRKVDEVAPGSGKDGSAAHYECSICEKAFEDASAKKELKPEDLVLHAWGDYVSKDNPTCAEDGTRARTCSICGKSETVADEGTALGHDETTKTSTKPAGLGSDGYVETSQVCKRCGEVLATSRIPVASVKSVSLAKTGLTYSGKANRPSVKVTDAAGNVLRSGVDYTVSYADDGKGVGTHKVTVKGKGNYSFSKALSFVVNPKGTSLSKVTGAKKALAAKWGKQSSQTTGYQLRWSAKSNMKGAKTATVKSSKTTSKKVTKLKKKTKYYVQVRTYKVVKGKTYYSAWSKAKSVKTK